MFLFFSRIHLSPIVTFQYFNISILQPIPTLIHLYSARDAQSHNSTILVGEVPVYPFKAPRLSSKLTLPSHPIPPPVHARAHGHYTPILLAAALSLTRALAFNTAGQPAGWLALVIELCLIPLRGRKGAMALVVPAGGAVGWDIPGTCQALLRARGVPDAAHMEWVLGAGRRGVKCLRGEVRVLFFPFFFFFLRNGWGG
jgi:hypothetical protein